MENFEKIPAEYLCPISHELMENPVIAADGYSYEKTEINNWFMKGKQISPMTGLPLKDKSLIDNWNLKIIINAFRKNVKNKVRNTFSDIAENEVIRISQINNFDVKVAHTSNSNKELIFYYNDVSTFKIDYMRDSESEIEAIFEISENLYGSYSSKKTSIEIWSIGSQHSRENHRMKVLDVHIDNINKVINLKDGNFASCSSDKTIKIWNKENFKCLNTLKGHEAAVTNIFQLNDGKILSSSRDGEIKIWDHPLNYNCSFTIKAHLGLILHILVLDDFSICTIGASNERIKVWHLKENKITLSKTLETEKDFVHVVKMENEYSGKLLCADLKEISIIDLSSGFYLRVHNKFTKDITSLIDLKNGRFASSSENEKTIRIWDSATGESVDSLIGHSEGIKGLFLTADNERLISYSKDKTVRFWDLKTGESVIKESYLEVKSAFDFLKTGKIIFLNQDCGITVMKFGKNSYSWTFIFLVILSIYYLSLKVSGK